MTKLRVAGVVLAAAFVAFAVVAVFIAATHTGPTQSEPNRPLVRYCVSGGEQHPC